MGVYPRYEVSINYSDPIFDIHKNEDGSFTCEFVDGTNSVYPPDTICDVTIMDNILNVRSLDDILRLFKRPKYHTIIGDSEPAALFQIFSGDPVTVDDFNDYCLDELILNLKHSLFGTLSKPKKMKLFNIYEEYYK